MMKTTTRARIVTVVLAAVVAGTLAGCGGGSGSAQETTLNVYDLLTEPATEPSAAAASEPAAESTAPPATGPGVSGGGSRDSGGSNDGNVASRLTPPGATVLGTQPGGMVLTASSGFDSLVAYYEGVLAQMGAQGTAGREGAVWGYVGTYDGREIRVEIAMVDAAGTCSISVSY